MAKRKNKKNEITHVRKVQLLVDGEAAGYLDGQSKIVNKLYNILKDTADGLRVSFAKAKEAGREEEAKALGLTLYTERGLRNLIPDLREQNSYLNLVHSSPLKNAGLRLSRAIRAYQDSVHGRRAGPAVQWPRFRAWKRDWMSLEYDEFGKGWKLVDGSRLQISFGRNREGKRLGISASLLDPPPGVRNARSLRIVKEHGKYFAIFTIVKPRRKPRSPRGDRIAYIDPNSSNMGVSLDTLGHSILIENIPGLAELDRRIDDLKNKRDRKKRNSVLVSYRREDGSMHRHYEASNRWKTLDRALKRLEHRRRERIKQCLYSTAHRLYDRYDAVGIGDWAPDNGDAGWGPKANRTLRGNRYLGKFRSILTWVALKRRKLAFVMDERGTTRTCSQCSHVVEDGIPPEVREWSCPECGVIHGRDENAAANGLKRLLVQLDRQFHPETRLPCSGLRPPSIRERSTWSASPGAPRRLENRNGERGDRHRSLLRDHGIKGSFRMEGHGQGAVTPVSIPPDLEPATV